MRRQFKKILSTEVIAKFSFKEINLSCQRRLASRKSIRIKGFLDASLRWHDRIFSLKMNFAITSFILNFSMAQQFDQILPEVKTLISLPLLLDSFLLHKPF